MLLMIDHLFFPKIHNCCQMVRIKDDKDCLNVTSRYFPVFFLLYNCTSYIIHRMRATQGPYSMLTTVVAPNPTQNHVFAPVLQGTSKLMSSSETVFNFETPCTMIKRVFSPLLISCHFSLRFPICCAQYTLN